MLKTMRKTLASWATGVQKVQFLNPFQPAEKKVTSAELVKANVSWVNICLDRLSSRTAAVPLRLYGTRGVGETFKDSSRCRTLPIIERTKLLERCQYLPSRKLARLKQAQEVVEVVIHPVLDLLDRMNDIRTRYEVFRELEQFIDLTGDGFWEVEFNSIGLPEMIWLLPSQNVRILKSKSKFIRGYSFGPNPEDLSQSVFLDKQSVLHFRRSNPACPYYGMGCLEGSFKAFELNEAAKDYNLALNRNMGVPSIIATFKDITSTDGNINKFKRLFQRAMVGNEKQGGVFVTTGDMDIEVVGQSVRDMAFTDGQKWTRKEILAAFTVGESMLEVDNVNRANAEAGPVQFEKYGILPRLLLQEAVLNKFLIPMYDEERIFLAFDDNVPQDSAFELQKSTSTFTSGLAQRNESRAMIGLPPLSPEDGGNDFVIVGGQQIIGGQPASQLEGDN